MTSGLLECSSVSGARSSTTTPHTDTSPSASPALGTSRANTLRCGRPAPDMAVPAITEDWCPVKVDECLCCLTHSNSALAGGVRCEAVLVPSCLGLVWQLPGSLCAAAGHHAPCPVPTTQPLTPALSIGWCHHHRSCAGTHVLMTALCQQPVWFGSAISDKDKIAKKLVGIILLPYRMKSL